MKMLLITFTSSIDVLDYYKICIMIKNFGFPETLHILSDLMVIIIISDLKEAILVIELVNVISNIFIYILWIVNDMLKLYIYIKRRSFCFPLCTQHQNWFFNHTPSIINLIKRSYTSIYAHLPYIIYPNNGYAHISYLIYWISGRFDVGVLIRQYSNIFCYHHYIKFPSESLIIENLISR
jgi:hypothetical protein